MDNNLLFAGLIMVLFLFLLYFTGFFTGIDETDYSDLESSELGQAVFAGGCFWCMEHIFEGVCGVEEVVSGYIGGSIENPTYELVSSGSSGHYEAVKIYFDPAKITYPELLDVFWRSIDPTDPGGQFHDRGPQYRSAIFYLDEEQKKQAYESRKKLNTSMVFDKPIVTELLPYTVFYFAEIYHQDYYKKTRLGLTPTARARGARSLFPGSGIRLIN